MIDIRFRVTEPSNIRWLEKFDIRSSNIEPLNLRLIFVEILAGTEQVHPMSPELFKTYIHELSVRLNSIEDLKCPTLNEIVLTHLLCADDLVLLALTKESLQRLIDEEAGSQKKPEHDGDSIPELTSRNLPTLCTPHYLHSSRTI